MVKCNVRAHEMGEVSTTPGRFLLVARIVVFDAGEFFLC